MNGTFESILKTYKYKFKDRESRRSYALKLAQKKIVEIEVERYKRKEGPNKNWNNFTVGETQKQDIKTFLKKRINFDSLIR